MQIKTGKQRPEIKRAQQKRDEQHQKLAKQVKPTAPKKGP